MKITEMFLKSNVDVMQLGNEILFCSSVDADHTVISIPYTEELFQSLTLKERKIDNHLDKSLVDILNDNNFINDKKESNKKEKLSAFIPFRLENGDWCVRCINELYVFPAKEGTDLVNRYREIINTFPHDDHRRIGVGFLENNAKLLIPAYFERELVRNLYLLNPSSSLCRWTINGNGFDRTFDKLDQSIKQGVNSIFKKGNEDALMMLVPSIFSAENLPTKPNLASYAVFSRHRAVLQDELPPMQVGRGVSVRVATRRAVAESIERLCGQILPENLMRDISANDLVSAIPMERFPIYSAHAMHKTGLVSFDVSKDIDWVEVESAQGKTALAPVDLIYYGAGVHPGKFNRIFHASSSGTAAHTSIELARKAALEELIERDALMLYWAAKATPPLNERLISSKLARLAIQKMDSLGFDVQLREVTIDLLPVVLAIAINRQKKRPYFLCGAGCADTIDSASEKAIRELETLLWHAIDLRSDSSIEASQVQSPIDHARFYCEPQNFSHVEFLIAGEGKPIADNVNHQTLEELTLDEKLTAKGIEVFYRDLTTKEVKQATRLHVVRAIATELIPITFGYQTEVTEAERLRRYAPKAEGNGLPTAPHFFS